MSELLQSWVARHAGRRPEATAVVLGGERLTYGALEQESNRLARLLREAGCGRGDRVCLLLPKSPRAIVAILGVLKADAIYVPLDPASPAPRLRKMIESCDDRWILSGEGTESRLAELFDSPELAEGRSVGWLGSGALEGPVQAGFSARDLDGFSGEGLDWKNQAGDPAHILFTSGSTGVPKGVVITHANVRAYIEWAVSYFGTGSGDRISSHPPLHFDLSTFDIFGTLAAGAELHLVPAEVSLLPHKLAELIRASELTQWFSVPSVLNYMTKYEVVRDNDFPALRRVLWCGEVMPTRALIHWMQRLPHARFTNLYGPTEATIASSYYTVPACPATDTEPIPIGTACAGEELLVLGDALEPLPPGEIGHLFIRGAGLSPGYWRDPEKTEAAFVPHPRSDQPDDRIYRTGDLASVGPDGLVYFHGRADNQIKSRGHRIELGEIETALDTLGLLRECAVVAVPSDAFDGYRICCAYTAVPGSETTPSVLRERLRSLLPGYMVPTWWSERAELPRNPNGKIDRRKIKELFLSEEVPTA